MAEPIQRFSYPVRTADVWGLNEDEQRENEDIAADLDFQDNAVEDYLNNVIPNIYIQQSNLASGQIDPNQLASGTPGAGKAPVGNPPAWTDIATQTELDAHDVDTTNVHGIVNTANLVVFGTNLQRGAATVGMNSLTSTTSSAVFPSAFVAPPRVTTTVLDDRDEPLFATLTTVTSGGFIFRTHCQYTTTATVTVFWVAVSQ